MTDEREENSQEDEAMTLLIWYNFQSNCTKLFFTVTIQNKFGEILKRKAKKNEYRLISLVRISYKGYKANEKVFASMEITCRTKIIIGETNDEKSRDYNPCGGTPLFMMPSAWASPRSTP